MRRILLLSVTCGAAAVYAAYTPYFSDSLTSINTNNWIQNGSGTASSSGYTSASGGTLISRVTAPGTSNDYMVAATISLPNQTSGGSYGVVFRASNNASVATGSGTYYQMELSNPAWSNGACSATINVWKVLNGSVYNMASFGTWCSSSFTISMAGQGTSLVIHQNGAFLTSFSDSDIASGQPGVSVHSAPSSGTISLVNEYPGDHTAPNNIDRNNISTSSYPDRIDMQWKGAADDANGSGIALFVIYRGTQALNGFASVLGEFTDNTVSPGTTYTYNIISCDYFYNCSNSIFNATSAPAGAVDPRQIGVRPTSTDWGAGGENINILSGNLNFSLPLLKAKARGGASLGIGLNYNSQNWRSDTSGTWNYGRDIGYGYGFRVGAGSIQKFYNANWAVDHFTFTDSTGTEYRLDKQVNQDGSNASGNTNIWASTTDSATFIFNDNNNTLYFPSGMQWQFGCTSLGNEGDYSSRYPTVIEDTNGNQILIRYKPAVVAVESSGNNVYSPYPNSSSRIDQIEDVRGISTSNGYVTYQFSYNNDSGVPHLTSIINNISTSESYSFSYAANQALNSPWGANFGTVTQLSSISISGIGLQYSLSYTTNGSMLSSVVFPYGGYLAWGYYDGSYSASRVQPEVSIRYLSKDGTTPARPTTSSTSRTTAQTPGTLPSRSMTREASARRPGSSTPQAPTPVWSKPIRGATAPAAPLPCSRWIPPGPKPHSVRTFHPPPQP